MHKVYMSSNVWLHQYKPPGVLRSDGANLLTLLKTKLLYGERSFSYAGPKVWNNLPVNIKTAETLAIFKKCLKTHLFAHAFDKSDFTFLCELFNFLCFLILMSYFLMCLIIVSIILPYVQRFWAVYLIWALYKFLFTFIMCLSVMDMDHLPYG